MPHFHISSGIRAWVIVEEASKRGCIIPTANEPDFIDALKNFQRRHTAKPTCQELRGLARTKRRGVRLPRRWGTAVTRSALRLRRRNERNIPRNAALVERSNQFSAPGTAWQGICWEPRAMLKVHADAVASARCSVLSLCLFGSSAMVAACCGL